MRKFFLLFTLAASTVSFASVQSTGSNAPIRDVAVDRGMRTCNALVQKMDKSPSENTLRNRIRTWKCRDDLSPDTPETLALLREIGR